MLTLLCTAPQSTISSPVEDSFSSSRALHSQTYGNASPYPGSGSSSSPTSSRKPTPLANLARRPSIRKRIQSFSRVSGASLDKATASLSSAAGSSFSFLRHSSGSGSSSSAGNSPGPSSAHVRGASTSSFASGKSAKSSKSSSSSGQGRSRLNMLNIGPPSAFKHQFHLGPDTRTSAGPWDESRGRQVVEMRANENIPVIDVVSSSAANAVAQLPRASTSSERSLLSHSHSHSHSQTRVEHTAASASSPNLLSISTSTFSPSSPSASTATPSASTDGSTDDTAAEKAKAARTAKRASLVKRKPVPPLYPEEAAPLPSTSMPNMPAPTAPASYVLMPDPTPTKAPETAPAGRTSFDVQTSEASEDIPPALPSILKQNPPKADMVDARDAGKAPAAVGPAHICVLHSAPPPAPPPRRHTLAHMQARALGRGMGAGVPSRPSQSPSATASETKTKTRPTPIIAASPESNSAVSPTTPVLPPGLPVPAGCAKDMQTVLIEAKASEATALADNSPRPSFSSLLSSASASSTQYGSASSTSEGGVCAHGSSSGSESGELEPRTPTDERRVSAGSAASISMKMGGNLTIVLSGDLDDDEEQEMGETPRRLRRVSKRPNPPVRRVEANEESVYVTADEADEGV